MWIGEILRKRIAPKPLAHEEEKSNRPGKQASAYFEIWGEAEERYQIMKIVSLVLAVLAIFLAYNLRKAAARPPVVVVVPGITQSYRLTASAFPEEYVLDFGRTLLSLYGTFRPEVVRRQFDHVRRMLVASAVKDFDKVMGSEVAKIEARRVTQVFWVEKESAHAAKGSVDGGYTIRFEGHQEIRSGGGVLWSGAYYYEFDLVRIPVTLSDGRGLAVSQIRQGGMAYEEE